MVDGPGWTEKKKKKRKKKPVPTTAALIQRQAALDFVYKK
jgi:hypothetical protein